MSHLPLKGHTRHPAYTACAYGCQFIRAHVLDQECSSGYCLCYPAKVNCQRWKKPQVVGCYKQLWRSSSIVGGSHTRKRSSTPESGEAVSQSMGSRLFRPNPQQRQNPFSGSNLQRDERKRCRPPRVYRSLIAAASCCLALTIVQRCNPFHNLFRNQETIGFAAGAFVVTAGDAGETMYVVMEGEVEILDGLTLLETAGAGSIVGELALIDDEPRSATVVAKTDCRLVPVDRKRFQYMVQETPFFALAVMKLVADRLRKKNARTRSS